MNHISWPHQVVAEEFCKLFYSRMVTNIPTVYELFAPGALCIINNTQKHIITCGVVRFEYHNLAHTTTSFDHNNLSISVSGMLRLCYGSNCYSSWANFNEIFVIGNHNGTFAINTHVLTCI